MEWPCVRVPRADGETTREALVAAGLRDQDREILLQDGHLYIPVDSAEAVPDSYTVVDHETDVREQQTMPDDLVAFPASYERIGDIVVVDEDDPDRARALADAITESALDATTVLNRASKIQGELRVRDWDVLAGAGTETVHREYGCTYALDLASVYFSPRLATERHRVTEQVESGERLFDLFAGVGPFVIPAAKRGATVVGVDKNQHAIEYLEDNAVRNGVAEDVTAIEGDVREVAETYADWADRLVMNLPHSADAFLETALLLAGDQCLLHYYDIQHEEDPFGPGLAAIEAAAGEEYDLTVETRRRVRSYAPHEVNVCLDVRLDRSSPETRNESQSL
jgi:tRNA (guanine37-N1)-methyltransferase